MSESQANQRADRVPGLDRKAVIASVGLFLTLVVVLLILVANRGGPGSAAGTDPVSPSPSPSPEPSTTSSPSVTIARLHDVKRFPLVGITLEPPPGDVHPTIDGPEAVRLAREEFPGSAGANTVVALFADSSGRLVWTVRFDGLCAPYYGPATPHPTEECRIDPWYVMIDAETGQATSTFVVGGEGSTPDGP